MHPNAELIQRFIREFRPEQIKEYLAKEVIGALPNASAIDLSQFSGLNAERGDEDADDDGYSELLAELRSANPAPTARLFEVNLIGRWSEAGPTGPAARGRTPSTPLAGCDIEIAIEQHQIRIFTDFQTAFGGCHIDRLCGVEAGHAPRLF